MTHHQTISVLVVEDDPTDLALIRLYLKSSTRLQYEVVHQDTIAGALETLKGYSADVTLLDLSLPDAVGLSAFYAIFEAAPTTPIVILTGNDDESMAHEAVREGAQDYLPKRRLDGFLLARAIRFAMERKQAEQKYINMALERERVHMISDFIRNVSHEFRTPLSIIRTSIHLLEMIEEPDERRRQYDNVQKQVDVILKLVEALITMSELDTAPTLTFHSIDVHDMLDMCLASLYHVAKTKQITLIYEPNGDQMSIVADHQKFHMAVRCLLDNAVRYTESGGSVWMDAFQDGNEVVIQITDTGKGIEPDILPHIFERFYREDQAHTTDGFGLGLPIAHAIIQQHHGHLSIKSTVGKGTIATIRVPTSKDQKLIL